MKPESFSRALGKLAELGVVVERDSVFIPDVERLAAFAEHVDRRIHASTGGLTKVKALSGLHRRDIDRSPAVSGLGQHSDRRTRAWLPILASRSWIAIMQRSSTCSPKPRRSRTSELLDYFDAIAQEIRDHFAREEKAMTEARVPVLHLSPRAACPDPGEVATLRREIVFRGAASARDFIDAVLPGLIASHIATADTVSARFLRA